MKKTTLTLLALNLLPLVHAGEAQCMEHVAKFCATVVHNQDVDEANNAILNDETMDMKERMELVTRNSLGNVRVGPLPDSGPGCYATAEEAVALSTSAFYGESRPQDIERLKQIWDLGSTAARVEALHQWEQEIIDGADADDSTVINIMTAIACWTLYSRGSQADGHHNCEQEYRLGYHYFLRMLSNDQPITAPRIRYYLDYMRAYMYWWGHADHWLQMIADVNADETLRQQAEYPAMYKELRNRGILSKEWKQSMEAEKAYLAHTPILGYEAWHQWGPMFSQARKEGMKGYSRRKGETLPRPFIDVANRLQKLRERGVAIQPDAWQGLTALADKERATAGESADSYTTRCMLALAPTAKVWAPLTAENTPLYRMPDISAIHLPQWDDALFGTQTTAEQDISDFAAQVEAAAAVQNKLGALMVLILEDGDRHYPLNEDRADVEVQGYNAFASYIEFETTPGGVDIVITNDGPRFSRKDARLQQEARALELALHRAMLKLAKLESEGKLGDEPKALAEIINKHGLWALVLNQYELRGISPRTMMGLLENCQAPKRTVYSMIVKTGNPLAATLAGYREGDVRNFDTAAGAHICTLMMTISKGLVSGDRSEIKEFLETARTAIDGKEFGTAIQFLCRCGYNEAAAEAWEGLLATDEETAAKTIQAQFSHTGYRLVKSYLTQGTPEGLEKAKKVLRIMTARPLTYAFPATRMAMAAIADAEGRTEDAARMRKDGIILAGIHMHENGYNFNTSVNVLLDEKLTGDLERIWAKDGIDIPHKQLRLRLVKAAAESGRFEQAAYFADKFLLTACKHCISGGNLLSQKELVELRLQGDFYRALDHIAKADDKGAKALPEARAALAAYVGEAGMQTYDAMAAAAQEAGKDAAEHQGGKTAHNIPARPGTHYLTDDEKLPFQVVSKQYTWHIQGGDGGPVKEVEGTIMDAGYTTTDLDKCWVTIRTDDEQTLSLDFNSIAVEDLDNIIEWHEANGFITCERNPAYPGLKPFTGRPLSMGAVDTNVYKDVPRDGRYVVFYTSQGKQQQEYVDTLAPEAKAEVLARFDTDAKPTLGIMPGWQEAKDVAKATKRHALAMFIGKHGGMNDRYFEQKLQDLKFVNSSDARKVLVISYLDENGNWDAIGQEVLKDLARIHPEMVKMVGPGSCVYEPIDPGAPAPLSVALDSNLWPEKDKEPESWKALMDAVRKNDMAEVERLVKADPELIHARTNRAVYSPLMEAAKFSGNVQMVKKLLELGFDPNEYNKKGEHILVEVNSYANRIQVEEALLEGGADPNMWTINSYTGPTSIGARCRLDNLLVLLRHGLDPNHAVSQGDTPMCVSVADNEDEDKVIQVLEEMIKRGLDTKTYGNAIRHTSERMGNMKVLRFLQEKGIK